MNFRGTYAPPSQVLAQMARRFHICLEAGAEKEGEATELKTGAAGITTPRAQ